MTFGDASARLETGNVREVIVVTTVFSDDHARVERVTGQAMTEKALVEEGPND